jgi:flagellar protein FliS
MGVDIYRQVALDTASPPLRVAMLLDTACQYVSTAEEAIQQKDVPKAHESLVWAQRAVQVLRAALKRDAHPELVDNLDRLYAHALWVLVDANVRKDAGALAALRETLGTLSAAWRDVAVGGEPHEHA